MLAKVNFKTESKVNVSYDWWSISRLTTCPVLISLVEYLCQLHQFEPPPLCLLASAPFFRVGPGAVLFSEGGEKVSRMDRSGRSASAFRTEVLWGDGDESIAWSNGSMRAPPPP